MASFTNRLHKYGICILGGEEHSPSVTREVPLIICEMLKNLSNEIYPYFNKELQDFCINDEAFQILLMKTTLRKGNLKLMNQPSILQILLAIKKLQSTISEVIIKKLTEYILAEDLDMVHMILDNLSGVYSLYDDNNVATQLQQMIDIGSTPSKIEILNFLPRIVAKADIDRVVKQLIQLVKEDATLREHIMHNFLLYDIKKETALDLTKFILCDLIKSPQFYTIFHLLFVFLMKHNNNKLFILKEIYPTLDKVLCGNDVDNEIKIAVHQKLYGLAKSDMDFNSALLKYDIRKSKTIDVYLFIVAYNVSKEEGQFMKNRLSVIYDSELMETFINNYCTKEMMDDLHENLLNLEVMLIGTQSENKNYGTIGRHLYRVHFSSKYCDPMKRNMMIYNIKLLLYKQPTIVIHILKSLHSSGELIKHTSNLLPFLALYLNLSMINFRCLFDVICSNAINSKYNIGDIKKFVDRLLQHCDFHGKKGIIAAISMAKHLAITDEGENHYVKSLLASAYRKCKHYQDGLGLYYDELGDTFVCKKMNKELLNWLNEDIKTEFEQYYVIFGKFNEELPIPVKASYELNLQGDLEEVIHLNIGVLVQKPNMYAVILALPALFRLFRLLTSCIFNGDLSEIDALLGCGILSPKLDDLDEYLPEDLMKVADCLFFMINWFRELLNAFISQEDNELWNKLLQRVNHIMELEDKLGQCLALLNEYKLPKCSFYEEDVNHLSVGHRQLKEDMLLERTVSSTLSNKTNQTPLNISKHMRIMDIDLFSLLKYPVSSRELSVSQLKSLTSGQFQFIVRHITATLNDVMNNRNPLNYSPQAPTTIDFLRYCYQLVPFIHAHFKQVAQDIGIILEKNDYCCDAPPVFALNCVNLKRTFDIIIEFYKSVVSWIGWRHKKNTNLLKCILTILCELKNNSINDELHSNALSCEVAEKFIEKISAFKNHCLLLSSAGNMLTLIQSVRAIVKLRSKKIDSITVSLAKEFLDRPWLSGENKCESGNAANKHIEIIISIYIGDNNIKTLYRLVETLNNDIKDELNANSSITFRAVNQSNIHILYKCICKTIVNKLNREFVGALQREYLNTWRTIAGLMQNLMEVSKKIKGTALVKSFCRFSVDIINIFLNHGIPTLGMTFQRRPADVHDILSLLLPTSIYLYRLSCQVTHKRNTTSSLVEVRISLHKLDKAVREMFAAHKHKDKIWLGILTNVDTTGEPILSQNTLGNQTSDDETEDDNHESSEERASPGQYSSELFE